MIKATLVYLWPLLAGVSFGMWQHSLQAGMWFFATLNVLAVLRKG